MKRFIRGSVMCAAAAMAVAVASPAGAQETRRDKEIRIDFASVTTSDGFTRVGLGYPGTLAMGIYMNNNLALEPRLGFDYQSDSDTDVSGGSVLAGVFAPWYFNGDMGRTGLFLSPGVEFTKGFGDDAFETDVMVDYGVDFGVKLGRSERVSTRLALTMRDGDSFSDPRIGAVFGVGMFWR
jgi:hypothetical protein